VIRNIIFDWSGTRVDDLPAVWQATNYVLTQSQRPAMSLEQFRAEGDLFRGVSFPTISGTGPNGAIVVARGPLVFALPLGEEWRRIHADVPGRELPHADWEVHPTSPWNFALAPAPLAVRELPRSGKAAELLAKYHIDANAIINKVKALG